MKYFDHKSFFYCHCGFSLQRTETFHKVFDADDYYIGMCHYSWQQQQNYKKQTQRGGREDTQKKSEVVKIVQKIFLTGGAIFFF